MGLIMIANRFGVATFLLGDTLYADQTVGFGLQFNTDGSSGTTLTLSWYPIEGVSWWQFLFYNSPSTVIPTQGGSTTPLEMFAVVNHYEKGGVVAGMWACGSSPCVNLTWLTVPVGWRGEWQGSITSSALNPVDPSQNPLTIKFVTLNNTARSSAFVIAP